MNSNQIETTFLIADLAGFTALTEAHGDLSAASIVSRYMEIVNDTLQPGSRLVERTGDEVRIPPHCDHSFRCKLTTHSAAL